MKWYALSDESILTALGDCGDEDAARAIADDLLPGGTWVWIMDAESTRDWVDNLNTFLTRDEEGTL
jgi:hypothetical protein